MKPSNKQAGSDKLTRAVGAILDQPGQEASPAQLQRLQQARERALARFDERISQPPSSSAQLALWLLRHARGLRRSMLALSFAMVAGTGVWLAEGLLVEEEAIDAAILSHELPLEVLMNPHFSGSVHG